MRNSGFSLLKYGGAVYVIALALGACAGNSPPAGEGALELSFTDVPECEQRDGDICEDTAARFLLTGNNVDVEFTSGSGGTYATTLPPGDYELQVLDHSSCVTPDRVQVQEGAHHRTDIVWPSAC